MTPFNPEGKDTLTYGECLHPAMKITEQADADQYMAAYVAYTQRHLDAKPRGDDMTAEAICKVNLGYFAGYYDSETMARVNRLFCTTHPVFGNSVPGVREAMAAGRAAAAS